MDSHLRGHQNGADVLVQGDVCHLEDGDGVVAHLHTQICIYCIMERVELTMLDPLKLCVKKRKTSSAMGSTLVCRYCRYTDI